MLEGFKFFGRSIDMNFSVDKLSLHGSSDYFGVNNFRQTSRRAEIVSFLQSKDLLIIISLIIDISDIESFLKSEGGKYF